jgi:endonuclease/exonuclease/phosphatase family metal-dependent hydrolase
MKNLRLYIFTILVLGLFLSPATLLARTEASCGAGQTPHFRGGFALLKSQLGEVMGTALECEYYDAEGNVSQRTTTGLAFYSSETNGLMFMAGNQRWLWTGEGLAYWIDPVQMPPAQAPFVETMAATPLRVMSYNILYGAGATPDWERNSANRSPFPYPGNRLPAILNVIRAAQPDLIGLQEVAGWEREPWPLVEQVAAGLGMNHVMGRSPSGLNVVLLTRFQIIEAEDLSKQVGNVGALQATLVDDAGQLIYVFVVHLDPFSAEIRERELVALTEIMAPYRYAPTILMGDLNMACMNNPAHCREYQLLNQAGWQLVVRGVDLIDQVWTSPLLSQSAHVMNFPDATFAISDHLPVGAILQLPPVR